MQKKKHAGAMVIAILHFIFGGLSLVLILWGVVQGQTDPTQVKIEAKMVQDVPTYTAYRFGNEIGLNVLLCLAMIVAGIGLLMMQSWGRILSIGYAVVSLLQKAFVLIYALAILLPVLNPALEEIVRDMPQMRQLPPAQRDQTVAITKAVVPITILAGPLIAGIYPIAVLWVMLLPSARRAFQASGAPFEDRPEDDFGDFQREERRYDDGYN